MKTSNSHPNCKTCKFFSVSWDKNYPHACSAFNMKSFALPAIEVFRRSGMQCLYFQEKEVFLGKNDGDEAESDKSDDGDDGQVIKSLKDNDNKRNIDYEI